MYLYLIEFLDSSDRISHSGIHYGVLKEATSAGFLIINPSSMENGGQGNREKIPHGVNNGIL